MNVSFNIYIAQRFELIENPNFKRHQSSHICDNFKSNMNILACNFIENKDIDRPQRYVSYDSCEQCIILMVAVEV